MRGTEVIENVALTVPRQDSRTSVDVNLQAEFRIAVDYMNGVLGFLPPALLKTLPHNQPRLQFG
jgi:hypothetical protein